LPSGSPFTVHGSQGIWDELSDFQWGALKKMAKSARLSRRKDIEE